MTYIAPPSQQAALIPDVPHGQKLVDKDGMITPIWSGFFDQLVLALQTNFKPEGFVIPQQIATNIALLTDDASIANIIYDSTNNEFKGNIAGTWKTFTLT